MVKPKQPNIVPGNSKRKKSSGDAEANLDLVGEDEWIVVKKQIVNIIIPPSPVSEQVTLPNLVDTEPQIVANPQIHSPCEKERSDSSIPKTIRVDDSGMCPQPVPDGLELTESVPEDIGVCNSSRAIEIKRLPISADRNAILLRRTRTMLIEKKLKQVGGLSKWLLSLGLHRFMNIFECNGVGKHQLGCLTMGELKEMGAYAVGPRRKLLHAIDNLCQPYCGT